MQPWTEFAKKYATTQNILYDVALESVECQQAYQTYKDDQKEKHRARVIAMTSKVDGFRKEKHRARVLAMATKVEVLVQAAAEAEVQRSEPPPQISELSPQIPCMTIPETRPTTAPQQRVHIKRGPRKTMVFTNK